MRALVSSLVGLGFDIIGDIAESGKLTRNASVYDEETGTVTSTPTDYPIEQIIETRFKATELGGDVDLKTDAKFIIYSEQLTTTPEEDDKIIYDSGEVWNVKKLMSVPGKSVWILHVTKA